MGYRVYSFGRKSSDMHEFEEAMQMAKEGLERVCELAEEMHEQYGERGRYGMREHHDGYGERHDYPEMGERRDRYGRYR